MPAYVSYCPGSPWINLQNKWPVSQVLQGRVFVAGKPKIVFLPNEELCPQGKTIEAEPGKSILDNALDNGIEIEHACEKSCACTTCHVIVREGFTSLAESDDLEDDLLDRAWGLTSQSRLSCQAIVTDKDLTVEIPKYTINQVSERK